MNLHFLFFLFMRALPSNSYFISFVTMPYSIIGITAEGYSFFSSFFIFHFKSYLFFFLLPEQKKKNQKRKLAVCTSSAKNRSRFWEGRKTCASRSLRCGPLSQKREWFYSRSRCEDGTLSPILPLFNIRNKSYRSGIMKKA